MSGDVEDPTLVGDHWRYYTDDWVEAESGDITVTQIESKNSNCYARTKKSFFLGLKHFQKVQNISKETHSPCMLFNLKFATESCNFI